MSNFFVDLISPNTGKSHKRLIATLASLTIIGLAITDAIIDVKIDPVLVDATLWLALGGMGSSVLERFAPTSRKAQTTTELKTTIVEPAPEDIPLKQ